MMFTYNKRITKTFGAIMIMATQVSMGAHAQQIPGRSLQAPLSIQAQTPVKAPTVVTNSPAKVVSIAPLAKVPNSYASNKMTKAEWAMSEKSDLVHVPLNKIVSVRLPGPVQNVVIGNPNIADVIGPNDGKRDHVYVLAKAVGSTSIIFEDGKGNILFKGDIQVDVDADGIQSAINELMPEQSIQVAAQRDSIFLKGFVRSPSESAQAVAIARRFVADNLNVINNLEILGSRQVILQVHVSEMKRTAIKELGFNFTYTKAIGNAANNLVMTTAATLTNAASAVGTILPGITGFGNIGYKVLEKNDLAKTLAEPALTAMSGETATFQSGGSVPIQSGVDSNGNAIFTQTDYGIRLSFKPTVMSSGQINLQVATEISNIDNSVAVSGNPGFTKNVTETNVDLQSGGSLIISGLIKNDLTNVINGVPGLKNLPILGALFRSEAFQNNETELVVTVTAYLAEPVGNEARLALPTDGFVASSDMDLYLLGKLHAKYAKAPLPPYATILTGPYGYIME